MRAIPIGGSCGRLKAKNVSKGSPGVIPAKDHISVKVFLQIENQSEEKLDKVREPALKVAHALLK